MVFVGYIGREVVVGDGDTAVGVACHDRELHGGGDERGCGGVEVVDGDAHHVECGTVGTVY